MAAKRTRTDVLFPFLLLLLLSQEWYRPDAASLDDSNDLTSSSSATARLKLESAQKIDRAELMKRKVIAPTDTKKLAKGCPICREKFKSEWSDEEEDWVFYNALSIDGTVRCLLLLLRLF